MTKLNLYLVRHGQTYFNIYNKLQGWSNSPLTEKGKENAVAALESLSIMGKEGDAKDDTFKNKGAALLKIVSEK